MTFALGAIVRLAPEAPRMYIGARGLIGRVEKIIGEGKLTFADVNFDIGKGFERQDALEMRSIWVKHLVGAASEARQNKLTRRPPLYLHEPKDDRTEKQKQDEAIKWLRHPDRGYKVLVVGQYMKAIQCTAEGCGHWFWPDGFGNSVGYPDLTVYHPTHWAPAGCRRPVLLLEFKRDEKAGRKPKQIELVDEGVSAFVWSLRMVAQEIYRFERDTLGITPHPALLQFVEESVEH